MPYIDDNKGRRKNLIENLDPETRGEVNFLWFYFSKLYLERLNNKYDALDDIMQTFNDLTLCSYQSYSDADKQLPYLTLEPENKLELFSLFRYIAAKSKLNTTGTASCCGHEFYGRYGRELEDRAIERNGDVKW